MPGALTNAQLLSLLRPGIHSAAGLFASASGAWTACAIQAKSPMGGEVAACFAGVLGYGDSGDRWLRGCA